MPATADVEVKALAVAEVVKLRAALATDKKAESQDLGDLVDILLATGCRIGEALALRGARSTRTSTSCTSPGP